MAEEINEITLVSNRCLYVKSDIASEIYFSNYYLKQLIGKNKVSDNFKIKFTDNKFMNETLVSEDLKSTIDTIDSTIENIKISLASLNMSLYSKLTYTPPAEAEAEGDEAAAKATQLKLDTDIDEDTIIKIKDKADKSIFTNKAQVRQYLKYDGLWYRKPPTRYDFDDREQTKPLGGDAEEDAEDTNPETAGGKKTKTRRRGKASHNKHRKSKRIR